MRRPAFKPHLNIEVLPGVGLAVLAEDNQTILQGHLYELIGPHIDGRTAEELVSHLRGKASAAQVFYTLKRLAQHNFLIERDAILGHPDAAWWTEHGVEPSTVAAQLRTTAVTIRTLGNLSLHPLTSLLESMGVRVKEKAPFTVVLTNSYLRSELEELNNESLSQGTQWFLAKPTGRRLWFGPLFKPRITGCWKCLANRILGNAPARGYLQAFTGANASVPSNLSRAAATTEVAHGLLASTIAMWAAVGELPRHEGKVHTIDLHTWQMQEHQLIKHPTCSECGVANAITSYPTSNFVLNSCKKRYTEDGGHRCTSPHKTLQRYGVHVSDITGAVPYLERYDLDEERLLHVYVAGPNVARPSGSLKGLKEDLRSLNIGKGITEEQAKASALCEALERYSAQFRGDEPRRASRLIDLAEVAIHPNEVLLFSDNQYSNRSSVSAFNHRFHRTPLPFSQEAVIDWSPLWSLTRKEVRYLPTAFCYFGYPQDSAVTYCWSCSNGNAAGNTLEEAILQGFLELVERDSVAIWWYNRVRVAGVDLDSFREPYLARVTSFLNEKGRNLWALDITSDLGIPTFVALSRNVRQTEEEIVFGFGAHLDARIALLRAITEMNQMLGMALWGRGIRNVSGDGEGGASLWLRTARVADALHLLPLNEPFRVASSYPMISGEDIREDVLYCQRLVEGLGMEMLFLDQTRPDIGLPVAKVVVPGLRHFWPRYGPGRLYDVPVKMGKLSKPLVEGLLNPVPMFL